MIKKFETFNTEDLTEDIKDIFQEYEDEYNGVNIIISRHNHGNSYIVTIGDIPEHDIINQSELANSLGIKCVDMLGLRKDTRDFQHGTKGWFIAVKEMEKHTPNSFIHPASYSYSGTMKFYDIGDTSQLLKIHPSNTALYIRMVFINV